MSSRNTGIFKADTSAKAAFVATISSGIRSWLDRNVGGKTRIRSTDDSVKAHGNPTLSIDNRGGEETSPTLAGCGYIGAFMN
jgi:hypothetical protein